MTTQPRHPPQREPATAVHKTELPRGKPSFSLPSSSAALRSTPGVHPFFLSDAYPTSLTIRFSVAPRRSFLPDPSVSQKGKAFEFGISLQTGEFQRAFFSRRVSDPRLVYAFPDPYPTLEPLLPASTHAYRARISSTRFGETYYGGAHSTK